MSQNDATTTNYSYDPEGQLTAAGSQTYSYDANGNPTGGTTVGTDNEVTSDGSWSYTYDAAGNRITATDSSTGDTWTYGYDAQNQMISAVETDGSGNVLVQAGYVYDPFGNRVEETVTDGSGTTVTRYAYDAQGQTLWATFDGSGNLETRYINAPGLDQVVAQVGASGTGWLLTDHLGSTRLVVNSQGNVLDQLSYSSFGTATDANPSYGELFQFTGWQYDVVTGLNYVHAPYYDPVTGTWMQQDPLGFAAGDPNLTCYVGNDPTNETDPSGLEGTFVPTDANGRWDPFPTPQPTSDLPNYISPDSPLGQELLRIQQNELEPIGPPSALEYAVPIWGSGRASINSFQEGQYLSGTFNGAMAIADFFVVKALATGGVKLGGGWWCPAPDPRGGNGDSDAARALEPRSGCRPTRPCRSAANYDQGRDLLDLNGERIFSRGTSRGVHWAGRSRHPEPGGLDDRRLRRGQCGRRRLRGQLRHECGFRSGAPGAVCTQKTQGGIPARPNLLNYQLSTEGVGSNLAAEGAGGSAGQIASELDTIPGGAVNKLKARGNTIPGTGAFRSRSRVVRGAIGRARGNSQPSFAERI